MCCYEGFIIGGVVIKSAVIRGVPMGVDVMAHKGGRNEYGRYEVMVHCYGGGVVELSMLYSSIR